MTNHHTITFAAKFHDKDNPRIAELRRIGWDQHDVENLSRTINDTRLHLDSVQFLYLRRLGLPRFHRGRLIRPLTTVNGSAFMALMDPTGPFTLDSVTTFNGSKFAAAKLTTDQYVSLIAMQATLGMHETVKTEAKAEDSEQRSHCLRVFGTWSDEEVKRRYVTSVAERFNGYSLQPDTPDFWWDTENHTFLSFDRNFIQQVPSKLVHLLKTVNSL